MATVQVTYWRDIPVLVTARSEANEAVAPLPPAFQDLVDWVAMREGLSDGEAYLAEWRLGPPEERAGEVRDVAERRADELATSLDALRARYA